MPAGAERGFFADYGGLATMTATRAQLRALAQPVRVQLSARAGEPIAQAAAALLALIPHASRCDGVAGALRELL
ncbi:MAG: hypothetical protein NVSMB51_22570 [Solirubrobacteraceae bacterium]